VKVVDFGLAKVVGSSKLTRAGMVFGTPHYMSPEQAAGEVVDHRADIYALGIVMYEMFTGKVPFEADSYMGVLTKHMYMAPAPPSQLSPELKSLGALEEVILRCLQKRPQARFDDLGALLSELDRRLPPGAAHGARAALPASVLADQLELPSPDEPKERRPFAYWPALAIGLAFVAGVALVMALRLRRVRPEPLERSQRSAAPPGPSQAAASAAGSRGFTEVPRNGQGAASISTPSAAPEAPASAPKPAASGLRPTPTPTLKSTLSTKRRPGGRTAGGTAGGTAGRTAGGTAGGTSGGTAGGRKGATAGGEIVDPWAH